MTDWVGIGRTIIAGSLFFELGRIETLKSVKSLKSI